MKTPFRSLASAGLRFLALLFPLTAYSQEAIPLVENDATWSVFDNGSTPTGTPDWKQYNHVQTGAWRSAVGPFGYKVDAASPTTPSKTVTEKCVAQTLLNYSVGNNQPANKYVTTYFRKTFDLTATQIAGIGALKMGGRWDDGIVVYINGIEVRRENMAAGTPVYATLASAAITPTDDQVFASYNFTTGTTNFLRVGTNVLAIELHQASISSSDTFLDINLSALPSVSCAGDVTVGAYQDFDFSWTQPNGPGTSPKQFNRNNDQSQLRYTLVYSKVDTAQTGFGTDPVRYEPTSFSTGQVKIQRNTNFTILTERIDAQNFKNIRASVDLRSETDATPWTATDLLQGSLLYSTDGAHYTEVPWFKYQAGAGSTTTTVLVSETQANHWQVPTIAADTPSATATVTAGKVTSIVVNSTQQGGGYATPPTVSFSGSAGTGATATAVLTAGKVTSVTVNNQGSGYTSAPVVSFTSATSPIRTTNPSDYAAFKPATWTDFKTPGASVLNTSHGWHPGNIPAVPPAVKQLGGLGYDLSLTPYDYNQFLDASSISTLKSEMLFTATPSYAGETRLNVRIPFTVPSVPGNFITSMIKAELALRYDDSIAVWVASDKDATTRAGVKLNLGIATEPATDSANPTGRDDSLAMVPVIYDITTQLKAIIIPGASNVLIIRGYNAGSGSNDLLVQSKLTVTAPVVDENSPAALDSAAFLMTTKTSPLGLIPDGVTSLKIKIDGKITGEANELDVQSYYIDNLTTSGDAKSAINLGSTLGIQLPTSKYTFAQRQPMADADGDGISNLLEYAFGTDAGVAARFTTLPSNQSQSITPTFFVDADGFVTMKFRVLGNGAAIDNKFDSNGYIQVNDILYQAESIDDAGIIGDWQSREFGWVSTVSNNDDKTSTVTIKRLTQDVATPGHPTGFPIPRYFYRIRVSTFRDAWVNDVTEATKCPFPEL